MANRTAADGVSYIPNTLNQYTSVGAQTYLYDSNGNLTNDGVNTYTYDEENRLSSFVSPSSSATYTYDGFNRRVSKTVNGVTTYFINDGDREIEERDATGALTADYVYGDDIDEVLTMSRNGNTYYYYYDGLGSVTEITNASGAVVENYTYDPYGAPSVTSTIGNPFYFTGRRLDVETGLYYYRARMYDPTIGRFLQRDPIGYYDSMNLYQYVGNNPVNWVDPSGKISLTEWTVTIISLGLTLYGGWQAMQHWAKLTLKSWEGTIDIPDALDGAIPLSPYPLPPLQPENDDPNKNKEETSGLFCPINH